MRRLAVLVAALLLVGCSAPDHGVVVDKKYHPPYEWVQSVCMAHSAKYGYCTMTVPIIQHEPARWELCLVDGDEEGCRNVDETTYHRYAIGSTYGGER